MKKDDRLLRIPPTEDLQGTPLGEHDWVLALPFALLPLVAILQAIL